VTLDRRDFVKRAGAALAAPVLARLPRTPDPGPQTPVFSYQSPDVAVIGAGAFGGWTALYLQRLGARAVVVDQYGPGNSRATSGDETRGVRSSYGERSNPELWIRWANEAMRRWTAFDEEWGRQMKLRLFFKTGDLILREQDDTLTRRTRELWVQMGVPHQTPSVEDVRREYPVIDLKKITVALFEPGAGVVRARRACEVVAETLRAAGGEVVIGTAALGERTGRRLATLRLSAPDATLAAGQFVFALGPWFPRFFPELMGPRMRTPLGHVHYFGTPPGNDRFTYPNLPSYNFPGVTGWPALPADNRGFRVRMRGDQVFDPDVSERVFQRKKDKPARKFLKERFPLLQKAPLLETRACHYEISTSRNFIIDRHPDFDNVWIAGGGSAEGFKFGPLVGEYAAQRVLGMPTDAALDEVFALKQSDPAAVAARRERQGDA
jgi:glycine/D-amino acid oxidase-like deaminating enzyme